MEIRITSDTVPQDTPNVWGDYVVWSDHRNGAWDNIYVYRVSTGITTQITDEPGRGLTPIPGEISWWPDPTANYVFQNSPNIDGSIFSWFDSRSGNYDIYMYDIDTGVESVVTDNPATQVDPFIDGDRIVWVDYRNASDTVPPYDIFKAGHREQNADIYMYDIAAGVESQITSNSSTQRRPEMDGNYIVWYDGRNDPTMTESTTSQQSFDRNYDIYMYDLSAGLETQITGEAHNQRNPLISGNRIVWMDARSGSWDVYMYDIAGGIELPIATGPDTQIRPAIWGNWIVYTNEASPVDSLKLYDLITDTETTITTSLLGRPNRPYIENTKIVWEDHRDDTGDGADVYLYEYPGGFTEAGAGIAPETVSASANVAVSFIDVTIDGTTTYGESTSPPSPPSGFKFVGNVFDLSTSAGFTGKATVKVLYFEDEVDGNESDLKIYHWNGSEWIDVTVSIDTTNNTVTGKTDSFSTFALVTPVPSTGLNTVGMIILSLLALATGGGVIGWMRRVYGNVSRR